VGGKDPTRPVKTGSAQFVRELRSRTFPRYTLQTPLLCHSCLLSHKARTCFGSTHNGYICGINGFTTHYLHTVSLKRKLTHLSVARFRAYSADEVLLKPTGAQLTVEFLEERSFSVPVMVLRRDGLGMNLPPSSFGVNDVEHYIGKPPSDLNTLFVEYRLSLTCCASVFVLLTCAPIISKNRFLLLSRISVRVLRSIGHRS